MEAGNMEIDHLDPVNTREFDHHRRRSIRFEPEQRLIDFHAILPAISETMFPLSSCLLARCVNENFVGKHHPAKFIAQNRNKIKFLAFPAKGEQ